MIGCSQYLEVDDVVDQGAVDKQLGGPQLEVDADVVGGQAVRAEVGPGDRLRTGGRWTGHTVVGARLSGQKSARVTGCGPGDGGRVTLWSGARLSGQKSALSDGPSVTAACQAST